jgi:hypothetical protein
VAHRNYATVKRESFPEDQHEPQDKRAADCAAAAAEFQKEVDRVKTQPVPQEAKAKAAREQQELYLNLCFQAISGKVTGDK